MELYHSQQQRKLIQNHTVLQQVLIHSPATKKKKQTNKMINKSLHQNDNITLYVANETI